jgi:hypothetical protein
VSYSTRGLLQIANSHDLELENLEERLAAIRSVVQRLPQANFNLLRRVSEYLDNRDPMCHANLVTQSHRLLKSISNNC